MLIPPTLGPGGLNSEGARSVLSPSSGVSIVRILLLHHFPRIMLIDPTQPGFPAEAPNDYTPQVSCFDAAVAISGINLTAAGWIASLIPPLSERFGEPDVTAVALPEDDLLEEHRGVRDWMHDEPADQVPREDDADSAINMDIDSAQARCGDRRKRAEEEVEADDERSGPDKRRKTQIPAWASERLKAL